MNIEQIKKQVERCHNIIGNSTPIYQDKMTGFYKLFMTEVPELLRIIEAMLPVVEGAMHDAINTPGGTMTADDFLEDK